MPLSSIKQVLDPHFRESFENELNLAFQAYKKENRENNFSHYADVAESIFLQGAQIPFASVSEKQLEKISKKSLETRVSYQLVMAGLLHGIRDKNNIIPHCQQASARWVWVMDYVSIKANCRMVQTPWTFSTNNGVPLWSIPVQITDMQIDRL